ncbi:MAG: CDP-diacylglycerol--glycerol-3-phosphate 3-phosphatidyltransferase [Bryobacterales bacterium]|nr:CDP-diacylglycerol--glycerol-3-phosphate 3-phosphatidyltransferase [Bryobacterales bacterium]
MNIPNTLTLLRIFFVPILVAVLVQENHTHQFGTLTVTNSTLALIVFWTAALTDLLDGHLARRWGQITTVGMLLDPIADKLLISAALISLVQVRRVPGWMAVILIGREFAVSGLRSIAAAEGYTIQASELGKTKMMSQVIAISLVLLAGVWPQLEAPAYWALWAVMLFSLVSAADYFLKFWRRVDERTKARRRTELLILERERAAMKAAERKDRAARARES